MNSSTSQSRWIVAAIYRFFDLADPEWVRERLAEFCRESGIKGTLIIAYEGINGTVAGDRSAIVSLIALLNGLKGFAGAEIKYAKADAPPFRRMKVRIKPEIVTMGLSATLTDRGEYVEASEWNQLMADPGTLVIDTRNVYETAIGTFEGAIDPKTSSFSEFPGWVENNRHLLAGKKIAMFCTGGIRCEKATAYLKSAGFGEVFHLKGGILRYLEAVPAGQSLWRGECFVFDERVAVTHGLKRGNATLCRACRRPLIPEDRTSPHYREGVSCPHCIDERTDADRSRYAQRQKQVELALSRGAPNPIGPPGD